MWPTLRGEIRLDGAALDQWEPDPLGRHIGYLPQDVELFEGTIAENISRFQPDAKPEDVIAAAQTAGAHELVLNLSDGYDTRIGEGGASLSGGQRQRVALARALYGNPFLVVLDEPNASLDGAGDEALNQAILAVRKRGGIVVVITHRPAALGQVDQVAIMEEGRIKAVGPRDEVLQSVMKRNAAAPAPGRPRHAQAAPAANLRRRLGRLREVDSMFAHNSKPSVHQRILRQSTIAGVAMIALFGGTIGLWAATSTLSGAVVAGGQFVVDTSVKKIQHSTGGIVGELRVQEGDRVSQGDLLVRLDETVTRANMQVVTKQLDEYLGRQARLEAERDGTATIEMPAEFAARLNEPAVQKIVSSERTLFIARGASREAQKDQLKKRIAQSQDEIVGLRAQQTAKAREAELIVGELKAVRDLYEKNLVPITRLNALERDAASIEGQRGQLIAAVAQAESRIAETQFQIIQIDEQMRAEAMQELREIQGKIAEYTERRVAAEDQLKRIDIRAPSDGYVHQLNVHTIGGVISPAEPVMNIVPINDKLELEARVLPHEIDQVKLGQNRR